MPKEPDTRANKREKTASAAEDAPKLRQGLVGESECKGAAKSEAKSEAKGEVKADTASDSAVPNADDSAGGADGDAERT